MDNWWHDKHWLYRYWYRFSDDNESSDGKILSQTKRKYIKMIAILFTVNLERNENKYKYPTRNKLAGL